MEKKYTLQDLAALLAERESLPLEQAEDFVRSFFELTEEGLLKDSFVKVTGFGTFKLVEVSERESVNINTANASKSADITRSASRPTVHCANWSTVPSHTSRRSPSTTRHRRPHSRRQSAHSQKNPPNLPPPLRTLPSLLQKSRSPLRPLAKPTRLLPLKKSSNPT